MSQTGGSQQCQSAPVDMPPDTLSSIQNSLLSQLGTTKTPCNMSSFNAAMKGSISGPLGMASGSYGADINSLNKTGCGDVGIVLQNLVNSVVQAKCSMTNLGNTANNTVTAAQLMTVKVGNNSTVYFPPDAEWTQNLNLTFKSYSNINSSVAQTISAIAQQGLSNTLKQLQANSNGYASTTSGSTLISNMQQNLSNKDTQSLITNNITKAINTINTSQTIGFAAGDNSTLYLPKTLSQNALVDLQIASIITSAYSGDMSSQLKTFLDNSVIQTQKNKSGGVEDLLNALGGSGGILPLIIGAVVVIGLGLVLMKFMKSKQGQDMMGSLSKKAGTLSQPGSLPISAFRRRRFF
jgi:hypothetical protein